MILQFTVLLPPFRRGTHIITDHLQRKILVHCKGTGMAHLFLQHTSASLCINENADPSVRADFDAFLSNFVSDDTPYFVHTYEGSDDMPAHIKTIFIGNSLTIPLTKGVFALGTWQGVYLCEHRNRGGRRSIVITVFTD